MSDLINDHVSFSVLLRNILTLNMTFNILYYESKPFINHDILQAETILYSVEYIQITFTFATK